MFNASFNNTILSTVAAAIVATSLSVTPAFAGGGGGGGERPKVSTISTTNADGSTTSIFSSNKMKTYTITRTKKGKVVSKKRVKKNRGPFIKIFNPDGTTRTVNKKRKPEGDFVTRHFPNGPDVTVRTPSKPGKAFIRMHNPDGTTTTVGER